MAAPLLKLLRVGRIVPEPDPPGATEILVADGRITAVGSGFAVPADWPVEVLEAGDFVAVPAFIDQHVHVTGGGGEGGFGTRCPPIAAEEIAARGIGTVVGVLGTDSVSRSPADLLAAVRGLRAAGLSAWMYTGAYRLPPPTLTGDVQRDLAWIPEVLGVGEIALSDHRSSQPQLDEIARLVADARVGGLLAGKRGICHFHLGDGKGGLGLLRALLDSTETSPDQIIPTHVNRNHGLLAEAADLALDHDATVDVTAFDDAPGDDQYSAFNAVVRLLERGVPVERITMSSDCNGSLPVFDERGGLRGTRVAGNTTLLSDWQELISDGVLPLERAIELISGNVARVLGLDQAKGRIAPGFDADITLLDERHEPRQVFVGGRCIHSRP